MSLADAVPPQHGVTFTAPVLVMDRKAEKW